MSDAPLSSRPSHRPVMVPTPARVYVPPPRPRGPEEVQETLTFPPPGPYALFGDIVVSVFVIALIAPFMIKALLGSFDSR